MARLGAVEQQLMIIMLLVSAYRFTWVTSADGLGPITISICCANSVFTFSSAIVGSDVESSTTVSKCHSSPRVCRKALKSLTPKAVASRVAKTGGRTRASKRIQRPYLNLAGGLVVCCKYIVLGSVFDGPLPFVIYYLHYLVVGQY